MEMKQYKAVFIDWDDTIGDFHGAADLALAEMYNKYHLEDYFASQEEFVELYKPHNLELWAKYGDDKVTKEYLSLDRFLFPLMHGSLYKNGGLIKTEEVVHLAMKMSDDFLSLTTAHFSLLPGAEDLVRYLAEKYPLTIVTNGFIEVQYEKFDKSGLRDCFAHIVLSEEVGCQKPNPRIYEEALRLNGLNKEDVVMIGDSWYSDIQGAINAGIDQIWVTEKSIDGCESTYLVNSLEEIKRLL
jgi:putative hydrolase of the HAD superfamily